MSNKQKVLKALEKVKDPEIGENVVDLGFIRKVEVKEKKAIITMVLTTPFCPMASYIISDVEKAVLKLKNIEEVEVNLDFDKPWTPKMMKNEIRKKLGFNKK